MFYQDGIVYFVSLALVTVGNIIFDLVGPPELRFMLAVPQGVLHSVLSCRMILHMYDFGRKEIMASSEETGTGMEFAPGLHSGAEGGSTRDGTRIYAGRDEANGSSEREITNSNESVIPV